MSSKNYILKDLDKAIKKLDEALSFKKTEMARDSAIKRFELCFDLCWKAIKSYARNQGMECYSPRSCFKIAFQLKLIDHSQDWFKMIEDRNTTAHMYGAAYADEVYSRLPIHLELFEQLASNIRKQRDK